MDGVQLSMMLFQLESYAPFCSMAVRKSFLTVDQQLATAPGPSHYTPDLEDHVKGGDSLKSKVCALHNTPVDSDSIPHTLRRISLHESTHIT